MRRLSPTGNGFFNRASILAIELQRILSWGMIGPIDISDPLLTLTFPPMVGIIIPILLIRLEEGKWAGFHPGLPKAGPTLLPQTMENLLRGLAMNIRTKVG